MELRRKVNVFISSKCDDKYKIVRLALKKLIEETGIALAYCYEAEPASSKNGISAYLQEIDKCDLFVLLVDNNDGVSDAVLKEFMRAKSNKKRTLCFFCNEKCTQMTEFQKDIIDNQYCKYKEV